MEMKIRKLLKRRKMRLDIVIRNKMRREGDHGESTNGNTNVHDNNIRIQEIFF